MKMRKSIPKRILCMLLTVMLLTGMVPVSLLAKDDLPGTTIEYYGRSALSAMENSKALLYAYDQLVSGIGASESEISVYNGTDVITKDEVATALDAYMRDHTEHFWIGNSYGISYNSKTILSMSPSYLMSGTELEKAKEAFDAAVSEMLSGITPAMSEYEREKLLHDRLAAKVTYTGADNAHNAYGALVEGKAVCEGYAEAYQYLLQCAGLQSFIAIGTSENPATGKPEGHAWNVVRVDGSYYHVDLTWNDQGAYRFYAYFNKTDADIKEDHEITETAYAMPVCASDEADYFTVNGGRMAAFNASTVGTMLKKGGLTAHVYVTGDTDTFIEAFKTNIRTVAAQAGVSGGFSYSYASLGREYILKLIPSGYTVSGTVTSFGNDMDDVTIQLVKSGASNVSYQTVTTGKNADYSVSGVAAGTYTLKVLKQSHVTRTYTVTVGSSNVTKNVKIYLPGDVNGDGQVNTSDIGKVNAHTQGTATLTGYAFSCADVSGDGRVNTSDVGKMNAHVKGTGMLW